MKQNALHFIPRVAEITLDLRIGHKCPAHFHETYAVGLFRGNATLFCRERVWAIGPGQIAVHHPREVHWGDPVGECAQDLVYVSPQLLLELFGAAVPARFPVPVITDVKLADALHGSLRAAVQGQCEPLCATIQSLFRRHGLPVQDAPDQTNGKIPLQAQHILHCEIATLSSDAGLSRSHFSRSFRRAMGLSPRDFRRQARVEAAREMIASGGKLADTAAEAGFADQAHMTRQFRAILGITPAAVKRR